jgi:UDP-N-acetylglucosamine--N-acetylmuramyl-(pentapeptide) pyrophosphoryl-undecaprenol N-acetylglucosamine transferase
VLVPYPFATGDHQSANAGSLKKAGAAVVVENSALNGESLAKCLKELLSDSRALRRMAAAAKKLGRPQAAAEVLKVLKGVACV